MMKATASHIARNLPAEPAFVLCSLNSFAPARVVAGWSMVYRLARATAEVAVQRDAVARIHRLARTPSMN
jgi:hypothetical protein